MNFLYVSDGCLATLKQLQVSRKSLHITRLKPQHAVFKCSFRRRLKKLLIVYQQLSVRLRGALMGILLPLDRARLAVSLCFQSVLG